MGKKDSLTAERLREVLHYDPKTGIFTWIKNMRCPYLIGKPAGAQQGRENSYIKICVDSVMHFSHRLAWLYMTGKWPVADIDHINRDKSDNRFDNLREATRQQNIWNSRTRSNSTTGYKGVSYRKDIKKWRAFIAIKGKLCTIGNFDSPELAADAYDKKAKEVHGEFAFLNHASKDMQILS